MKTWTPKGDETAKADLTHHIGYDLLGPVVHRWLLALHQHLVFHDDGSTVALFCARAGVRISELYDLFLADRPATGPARDMFWVSRLAVAKGVFDTPQGTARSIDLLTQEYRHHPLRDLVSGITRQCPELLSDVDLQDRTLDAHGHNFSGWMTVNGPVQRRVREFLRASTAAFDVYLDDILDGRKRALLIDSGWQGTTQSLLTASHPDTTWRGLYFGRILTPAHDPRILPDCIGLMFEGEHWDPDRPETAFVRHRHLIEALLEPASASIEDVRGGPAKDAVEATIASCRATAPDPDTDQLYLAVRRYVTDHAGQSPVRILAAHTAAMSELARMIVRPTAEEALVLAGKGRSADFGKPLIVPVIRMPGEAPDDDRETRIDHALWTEGQIALEHPPILARELQDRASGSALAIRPAQPKTMDPAITEAKAATRNARVAVITRTKNRPVLLRRAAQSVGSQTLTDLAGTVVNDGGDADEVARIMRAAPIDPRRMTLVSHAQSQGMEAASNAGIAACESDYIVIHDDDDSWQPEFLERTIAFLDAPEGARYGGVATHSHYISEEIRDDTVVEHDMRPYNSWVRNVHLSEMACGNFFPPIAFVFRRSVLERIGGFNETLPVLGDWFFNLEFLLEDDIAILPEPLARYHHRDRGTTSGTAYANSVIGGVSKHEEFAAVARNAFLRRHGDRAGVAASFAMGYGVSDLRGRIGQQDTPKASPPARPRQGSDDRLWCVAELNAALGRRAFWRRIRRAPPVPADIGWTDLVRRVQGSGQALRAPADFDEETYLRSNPDVEIAVREGRLATGYMHYVLHGRAEGRPRQTRGAS
jgi:glycosyltransferase involved in cell wall biosynthesis